MAGECTFLPDDDIFGVLEADIELGSRELAAANSSGGLQDVVEGRKNKRLKISVVEEAGGSEDGQPKTSHINRRKQMIEHLSVLRSLMPCFYVKRGDQASIIGGVVDYITELQQILQSLEAKKQRKVYTELVLSPRLFSSPRKPPFSPKPSVPFSPRTPQPASPYRPMLAPFIPPSLDHSSPSANSFTNSDNTNELVAYSRSAIAEVEVKFMGGNLLLTTCSNRILGQSTKVIAVIESLSLEVLQAMISVVDETMVNSFTIKIGVECQLSADELVRHIQLTFC